MRILFQNILIKQKRYSVDRKENKLWQGGQKRVLNLLEQEFTDCCESSEMGSGNQALGALEGAVS